MRFTVHPSVLLLALIPLTAVGQTAQTYSDVREVEETADLVGTELRLLITNAGVTGTLRHYEGSEPAPIEVAGILEAGVLTLNGTYPNGKVLLRARLQHDRLIGTLSYQLPGQTNDVELNLPRVERPRKEKTRRGVLPNTSMRSSAQ